MTLDWNDMNWFIKATTEPEILININIYNILKNIAIE